MMHAILSRLFPSPPGGSTDLALGYEGISVGWAFFLLLLLAVAIWWLYRWGAPGLSRIQRGLLTGLRILLVAVFLILLVKPVILLTTNEPVRERLVVLVDASQSMEIKDVRTSNDDLNRAALAAGLIAAAADIHSATPGGIDPWRNATRAALLRALAANDKLNLWARLHEKADLEFYRFGREARKLGPMGSGNGEAVGTAEAEAFFKALAFTEDVTAIGDSLRQVLDDSRGQPVAGVLVMTDGANNTGTPPEEVAGMAKQNLSLIHI